MRRINRNSLKIVRGSKPPNLSLASKGYTLIELLLYVAIVGSLLMGVSLYFISSTESRIKNQSIAEVNHQGNLVMEHLTQIIRNSDSITLPSANSSAASLTLSVPTGSLSPTIFNPSNLSQLGVSVDGTGTDSNDSNFVNASSFTAATSGTVTTLYARVASVATSPNNKARMAIYSGESNPTTLLASSSETTLTANEWNSFTIPSTSITSGQRYWLAYNTNGLVAGDNDLRERAGTTNQSRYIAQAYGSWPASYTGTGENAEFSVYADVISAGGGSMQIKEGTGSTIALTNGKVQVSDLTFTNLTRSGTPGVVQISFTIARVNTANKNEYSYQRTFTGTAAVRP